MKNELTPASGLILLRDAPQFEVLMTERSASLGFAGGALVFPGGKVDPSDYDPCWGEHSIAPIALSDEWRVAAVAAAREAFEEAGIIYAVNAAGEFPASAQAQAVNQRWRSAVACGDARFQDAMRAEGLRLALDRMTPFAHWVAPPNLHRRFDNRLFAAHCPPGQEASADGVESTEAYWVSPRDALDAAQSGKRKLIFPTKMKLALLATYRSAQAALDSCEGRPLEPIQPTVETRDGEMWLTIPAGSGYPWTEELLSASMRG